MNRLFQFVLLLLIPTMAFSYELNGSLSDYDDGDGTYSVIVQNADGHEYIGVAEEKSDGSLIVSVKDDKGDTYEGTATVTESGHYDLNLKNISTGNIASGELERE